MSEKSVTLTLNPVTVVVEGNTEEEILKNAKEAYIKALQEKFPSHSYAINDSDVLTFEKVKCGLLVETKDGRIGIVTAINKKTINVVLKNDVHLQGAPQVFKLSSSTFEDFHNPDRKNYGFEGDTGYLFANGKVLDVVVGKKSGKKYKVYAVNGSGGSYSLTEQQLDEFLKTKK